MSKWTCRSLTSVSMFQVCCGPHVLECGWEISPGGKSTSSSSPAANSWTRSTTFVSTTHPAFWSSCPSRSYSHFIFLCAQKVSVPWAQPRNLHLPVLLYSFFLTDSFSLYMLQKPEKMGLNIAPGWIFLRAMMTSTGKLMQLFTPLPHSPSWS